jgi:large subunit ribosomal protein L6
MSKIGRKPISIDGVSVDIQGQNIHYKGPKASDVYLLPELLSASVEGKNLFVKINQANMTPNKAKTINCVWGLHHALLKNKLSGAVKEFEKKVKIVGLGCKAEFINQTSLKQLSNKKYVIERDKKVKAVVIVGDKSVKTEKGLLFILGKSHFFYFILPASVSVEIDKTGQNLVARSIDPVLLGLTVSNIKKLRVIEPYKGTGIREENEIVRRKAGKTKAG